jgi:2-oxoglutarate/2-oxoacid ferredoxin oxidoreductase subunit alpha
MAKKEIMRFELVMDAGNGAQKAGDILIQCFAKAGKHVFIEPLIPAEISPPKRTPHSMSGVVIRVSQHELSNIGSTTDFMISEHEILLETRLRDKEYTEGATILLDMGNEKRAKDAYAAVITKAKDAGLNVITFDMDDESLGLIRDLNGNGKNMYYLGMLAAVYQVSMEDVEAAVRTTFKKLSEEKLSRNISILKNGYKNLLEIHSETYDIPSEERSGEKILIDGNLALSLGIIDSGIKLYSGYPITPASSIMHHLAKFFPSYGGMVHQAEDEISAIGTAVGSYFAGVPAVTATSGPGLSLKQEFIGLAQVSETPLIVIDVQRGGPSTGLPTRTEQTDLFAAAFGGHGDNSKIVISVSNVEDCFYAPHVARYLTEKLRTPVFILSDYLTSVSYKVLDKFKLNKIQEDVNEISDDILSRFGLSRLPEVEMVKSNQSVPGEPGKMRRLTGLNTNVEGQIEYTADSNQRSHTIRNEKVNAVRRALQVPEMFGEESGDVLVVAWGSCRGVLDEAIKLAHKESINVTGLHLKVVYPLPLQLKEIFSKFKKVVTVEVAYGDEYKPTSLAMMLRSETLVDVQNAIADATGRPLKPKQILAKIKELS